MKSKLLIALLVASGFSGPSHADIIHYADILSVGIIFSTAITANTDPYDFATFTQMGTKATFQNYTGTHDTPWAYYQLVEGVVWYLGWAQSITSVPGRFYQVHGTHQFTLAFSGQTITNFEYAWHYESGF